MDLLIALLLVLIVMMEVRLAVTICQVDAETPQVEAVMSEAQARIDAYYASLPARERPVVVSAAPVAPVVTVAPVVEEPETPEWYIEDLPLDKQLQKVVFGATCENGVDYFTALGLIQVESNFQVDAVHPVTGCYGLCQLNPAWFPSGLTPEENVRAGMEHLGSLIEQYSGDEAAALRAYNRGFDNGDRAYSAEVLAAREEIMREAGIAAQ